MDEINFLDGKCPRWLRKQLPNSTWFSVPASWDGKEPQRSWIATIDHLELKMSRGKITFLKIKMCWWKGVLKNQRKARKETGTLFSTRQVHLPNTAFGFSSSPGKRSKIMRYVRLHPLPQMNPVATVWSCRETWVGGLGGGCSEPSRRTKLQRNVIQADVLLPGPRPAIPQVLACLSFFPLPAPWSSAPPDHPALNLPLLYDSGSQPS